MLIHRLLLVVLSATGRAVERPRRKAFHHESAKNWTSSGAARQRRHQKRIVEKVDFRRCKNGTWAYDGYSEAEDQERWLDCAPAMTHWQGRSYLGGVAVPGQPTYEEQPCECWDPRLPEYQANCEDPPPLTLYYGGTSLPEAARDILPKSCSDASSWLPQPGGGPAFFVGKQRAEQDAASSGRGTNLGKVSTFEVRTITDLLNLGNSKTLAILLTLLERMPAIPAHAGNLELCKKKYERLRDMPKKQREDACRYAATDGKGYYANALLMVLDWEKERQLAQRDWARDARSSSDHGFYDGVWVNGHRPAIGIDWPRIRWIRQQVAEGFCSWLDAHPDPDVRSNTTQLVPGFQGAIFTGAARGRSHELLSPAVLLCTPRNQLLHTFTELVDGKKPQHDPICQVLVWGTTGLLRKQIGEERAAGAGSWRSLYEAAYEYDAMATANQEPGWVPCKQFQTTADPMTGAPREWSFSDPEGAT